MTAKKRARKARAIWLQPNMVGWCMCRGDCPHCPEGNLVLFREVLRPARKEKRP